MTDIDMYNGTLDVRRRRLGIKDRPMCAYVYIGMRCACVCVRYIWLRTLVSRYVEFCTITCNVYLRLTGPFICDNGTIQIYRYAEIVIVLCQ